MSIQVHNLCSGDLVTYSLPLLAGEVKPPLAQGTITAYNTVGPCCKTLSWPVFHGRFKALVPLTLGENVIHLKYFEEVCVFRLIYRTPPFKKFVRPVYIKCCDDDGRFQGPEEDEDCSEDSARRRISLGVKLLQTFTAEKMHAHGLGRKTYILESDLDASQPPCHILCSKLKMSEAHSMSGGDLWMYFAKELMTLKQYTNKESTKWFAFMSFTRYQPPEGVIPKSHSEVLRYTKGYTALGGGGLALCGTGTLHCWAEHLQDVSARFTDTRKIDKSKLMDDSAYREFHWANYSTGLGASLHELGHTFDLAHTPTGVMARGFDDLYRVFTVQPLLARPSSSSFSGSQVSSPIAYSPKQSPVHRPKPTHSRSRSGSPRPSPLSCPTSPRGSTFAAAAHLAGIIQVETAFKKLRVRSSQTFTVRNYDGSETTRTAVRHPDGTETVSELTVFRNGEQTLRETLSHVASGKSRTTISLSTTTDQAAPSSSLPTSHCSSSLKPSSLPKSLDEDAVQSASSSSSSSSSYSASSSSFTSSSTSAAASSSSSFSSSSSSPPAASTASSAFSFQEGRYRDGGAHWYRSSAVLLSYHKWFNPPDDSDPGTPPVLEGNILRASSGLRLIELRSVPEGVVFHHWEFLHNKPPHTFRLRRQEVQKLSHDALQVGLMAEDTSGNILKKKFAVHELGDTTNPTKETTSPLLKERDKKPSS